MKEKKSILKGKNGAPHKSTVYLGGIPVTVTRKRMKTVRLRIRSSDRTVHLSIPTNCPDERAMLFLSSKEAWIRETLAALPPPQSTDGQRLESGAEILLWGERYTLDVTEGAGVKKGTPSVDADADTHTVRISVPAGTAEEKLAGLIQQYRARVLLEFLSEALPKWEALTGLKSASHDVRDMKSRWGSCNVKTRHVRLNTRLTEHPKHCTEYVVLHELCHLKIPSHGKDFHALVTSFMPEWKTVRALLNGKKPS